MVVNIGDIVDVDGDLCIVTKIKNGHFESGELLDHYIARNFVIEFEGEYKTLKDIIDEKVDEFLKGKEIKKIY